MGVHDPGIHALATCRGVNVHGVPSQQDPPTPVRRSRPELTAETCQPHRVGDNDPPRRPLVDELLDLLYGRRLSAPIASVGHYDSPALLTHRNAGKRQAVWAEEHVYLVLATSSIQGDVCQQPVLCIGLPIESQPEFVTYPAVRAVATHHVAGPGFGIHTREVPKSCVDGASVLGGAHQFHTLFDDATQLAYAGAQQHFGLALGKHECEPVWRAVSGEVKDEQGPLSGVHAEATHSVAAFNEGVRKAHNVEYLEGARLDTECPRLRHRTDILVDGPSPDAAGQ